MRIGRFTVKAKLDEGAYGQVLLAEDDHGGRVALKLALSESEDAAEHLRHEGRVGMLLRHPHLVQTREVILHENRPVLVLEYTHGVSLSNVRKHLGPLPPALIVRVGRQIAEGLHAMHIVKNAEGKRLELLHRDVAPTNILLDEEGNATLIDLGISRGKDSQLKRTEIGKVRGTMRFMAPELIEGGKHSPASDLWALGIVLFESLLGRQAVSGDERAVLAAIVRGSITELKPGEQVNPRIDAALRGLLSPIDTRLQNANAAAQIFKRLETQFGPPPAPTLERLGALTRRLKSASAQTQSQTHSTSVSPMPRPITLDPKPMDSLEEDSLDSLDNSDASQTVLARPPSAKPSVKKVPSSEVAAPTKRNERPTPEQLRPAAPVLAPFSENDDEAATIVNEPKNFEEPLLSAESENETVVDTDRAEAIAQLERMRDTDDTMRFPLPPKTAPNPAPKRAEPPFIDTSVTPLQGDKTLANPAPPRAEISQPAQTMQMAIPNVPGAPPLKTAAPPTAAPNTPSSSLLTSGVADFSKQPAQTMQIPIPGASDLAKAAQNIAPLIPSPTTAPRGGPTETMRMAVPVLPQAIKGGGGGVFEETQRNSFAEQPKSTQMMPIPGNLPSPASPLAPPKGAASKTPASPRSTQMMPTPGAQHPPIGNANPNEATVPTGAKAGSEGTSTQMMPIPGAQELRDALGKVSLPDAETSGRHQTSQVMPEPAMPSPSQSAFKDSPSVAPSPAPPPRPSLAAKAPSLAKGSPLATKEATTNAPQVPTPSSSAKGAKAPKGAIAEGDETLRISRSDDFDDSELAFKSNKLPLILIAAAFFFVVLAALAYFFFAPAAEDVPSAPAAEVAPADDSEKEN